MSTPQRKTGISAVYSSSTESITTVFRTVNKLSSAAEQLAGNAEIQAMTSRVQSSSALLDAMGVDTAKMEAIDRVNSAVSLMEALRNM